MKLLDIEFASTTIGAAIVASVFVVPPGLWFQVGDVTVTSAPRIEEVTIAYDREVHWTFRGEWRVQVWDGAGNFRCSTPWHPNTYRIDTPPIGVKSWNWFVEGWQSCMDLGPGKYDGIVEWIINTDSRVFRRTVTRSFKFEIAGGP